MNGTVKTKTFWGGIAAICIGIGLIVSGEVPAGLNAIVGRIVAIFLRDSIAKITP